MGHPEHHAETPDCSEQHAARLGSLLLRTRTVLTRQIEQALQDKQWDLRISQLQVLLRLTPDQGATAGELARDIGYDPGAMTRLIDQLVRKGLVERQPHESDRRAVLIHLTAQGVASHQKLLGLRLQVMNDLLQPLQVPERELLMQLLQRMLDHVPCPAAKELP